MTYVFCFRRVRKSIAPKIVRIMAKKIAQWEYGPAPKIIGIGPMNITVPTVETPEKTDATIIKTIPTKIRRKPKRNTLKVVGHRTILGDSFPGVGTSRLRRS